MQNEDQRKREELIEMKVVSMCYFFSEKPTWNKPCAANDPSTEQLKDSLKDKHVDDESVDTDSSFTRGPSHIYCSKSHSGTTTYIKTSTSKSESVFIFTSTNRQ